MARVALHMEQVKALKLPPNPAKTTDSRAADYIGKFGHQSWELDALEPKHLVGLVTTLVKGAVSNKALMEKKAKEELSGQNRILEAAKKGL